ncbi:CoA-transferase family III [Rhizodiscina lignyota]|uniref:CoA-transferase family III n=1 Tax=Rhizodiscina lignyota TaxID=1504668 RepID=A0A9P4IS16_9PEZI|nr:CoA-transferase family III [Rhizodiscina lignyota]
MTSLWNSQVAIFNSYRRYYSAPTSSSIGQGGPLQGVRVLDFTRILAGPFCTQLLGDYGADVIKVEQPGKGDETRVWKGKGEAASWKPDVGPISFFFAAINRNKRSISLDLKNPEGRDAIHRLVKNGDVDVMIENFVPGTADRLGIGYETLSKLNPRLIYASLSGYGSGGPYKTRAGYDAIAAAEAGFMQVTGHPNQPPVRAGLGMTDMSTGLFTHGAIIAALYSREKTGKGQFISASLFESQVSMLVNVGVNWLNRSVEGERYGAAHPSAVPYNAWKCKNDLYMVIAANSEQQYKILCTRIGRPELIEDERFKTNALRVENRKEIDAVLADVLIQKTSDEWLKIFDGSGLAHGPVNTIERAFQHPQVHGRDMIVPLEWDALESGKWKAIGPAVKFSGTPAGVRIQPPRLGQHNEEVLSDAGYSREELEGMRSRGVF